MQSCRVNRSPLKADKEEKYRENIREKLCAVDISYVTAKQSFRTQLKSLGPFCKNYRIKNVIIEACSYKYQNISTNQH